jgi:hypothetical protein
VISSDWKFSAMCCSFNEPQFALLTLSLQTWDDAWCPWLKEMVYCNSMHTCHNHWSHKLHQNTSCTCNYTQLDSWSKLLNLTHMWIHREMGATVFRSVIMRNHMKSTWSNLSWIWVVGISVWKHKKHPKSCAQFYSISWIMRFQCTELEIMSLYLVATE